MIIRNKNPKGSNVYNIRSNVKYSTPTGSHFVSGRLFYKHCNPTDCFSYDKLKEAVK